MTHGAIYDFINKLKTNPTKLEILGDGTQTKSYIHVNDCVEAITEAAKWINEMKNPVEIYNIGTEDQTNIIQIAQIVKQTLNLNNAELITTGGVDGGRGWRGDVKKMLLDITKAKKKGWKPTIGSTEAVRRAAEEMAITTTRSHRGIHREGTTLQEGRSRRDMAWTRRARKDIREGGRNKRNRRGENRYAL